MTIDVHIANKDRNLLFIMHVLRDCDEAIKFWSPVIKSNYWAKFFGLGLRSWIDNGTFAMNILKLNLGKTSAH
jgi:hypothetical protein